VARPSFPCQTRKTWNKEHRKMATPNVVFNLLYAKPYDPGTPPSDRTKWRDWVAGDLFRYATRKDAVDKESIEDIKTIKTFCENTELSKEDATAVLDSGFDSYFDYATKRPGSSGAFDAKGDITEERAAEIQKEIKTTKSIIWTGILSFEEDYGKKFCNDKEAAYNMMLEAFPSLFKHSHLKYENIGWYAALHRNTDNRHIHITFWEKEPTFLRKGETDYHFANVAKIKQEACIDFKFTVAKHFEVEKFSSYKIRDNIRENIRNAIKTSELKDVLTSLLTDVKDSNSWQFGKQNVETQNKILKFALGIISRDETLQSQYDDYVRTLLDQQEKYYKICHENNLPIKKSIKDWANNNLKDLHNRLGNDVIASLKYFDKECQKVQKKYDSHKKIGENIKKLLPEDIALLEKIYSKPTGERFKELFEGNYTTDNTAEAAHYYNTEEAAALSLVFRLINYTQDKEQFLRLLDVSGVYSTSFDDMYNGQLDFLDCLSGEEKNIETKTKSYKEVLYDVAINSFNLWHELPNYDNTRDINNLQKDDSFVITNIKTSKWGEQFDKIVNSRWENTAHDRNNELQGYHLHCFHLVNLISKFTQDKKQIERIFKASPLYRPTVWDKQYNNEIPFVAATQTGISFGETLIAHCVEQRVAWKQKQGKQGKQGSQRKKNNLILSLAHQAGRAVGSIVQNTFNMLNTRFDNSFSQFQNAIKEQERRRKKAEGDSVIYE